MTVGGDHRAEPLASTAVAARPSAVDAACEICWSASASSREHADRYPHEFCGGQRQRIGIARALALEPELHRAATSRSRRWTSRSRRRSSTCCKDLQDEFGLTYLFIAHDLRVVEHISDRVAVMYLGEIVELADKRELFRHPLHPYTQALLSAVPIPDPTTHAQRILLEGDIPSPTAVPQGCRFSTRCAERRPECMEVHPELVSVGTRGGSDHLVRCLHCQGMGG